ncbi:MAG: hypothetical protein HY324_03695 [Chlamydiia bacterium]|nr:hypothetical protein [Chlamydiia bacterium]
MVLTGLLFGVYTECACDEVSQRDGCSPSYYEDSFFGFADVLVWEAKEEGLDYAAYIPVTNSVVTSESLFPHALDDKARYNVGFRVGFSYQCPCPNWDATLYWTYFHPSQKASFTVPPHPADAATSTTRSVPVLFNPSASPALNTANGEWKVLYDVVDLDVGYFFRAPSFQCRPHIGIRSAWINQKMDLNFNLNFQNGGASTSSANFISLNSNQFWGMGLRSGADATWHFWNDFSLFGKSGVSLLWGQYNVSRQEILTSALTVGGITYLPGTTRAITNVMRYQLATALDLIGGFGWHTTCYGLGLDLSLAWEFQLWFSQNQLLKVVGNNNINYVNLQGDFSTQGLTAGIAVTF